MQQQDITNVVRPVRAFIDRFRDLPVGFMLRASQPEIWRRFHALPESKRYPMTPAERRIILDRANALGGALIGEGQGCLLTASLGRWAGRRQKNAWKRMIAFKGRGFLPCGRWPVDRHEPEWGPWSIYACPAVWRAGAFDDILAAVADDRIADVAWIDCARDRVFCPYDGGFDLFAVEPEVLRALEEGFADWRSPLPSGL